MNKEEIESLFKKYKVRIPKEKQGQSECYECKRNNKYSLTWTSFLYEYKENYYCFEHIVNILLQQENHSLKKQLHNASIQIQEMIEQDIECPSNCSKLKDLDKIEKSFIEIKNQQKEFIEYLTSYIDLLSNKPDLIEEAEIDILEEILSKYKEIIGSDINVGSIGDKE